MIHHLGTFNVRSLFKQSRDISLKIKKCQPYFCAGEKVKGQHINHGFVIWESRMSQFGAIHLINVEIVYWTGVNIYLLTVLDEKSGKSLKIHPLGTMNIGLENSKYQTYGIERQ